jgi:hypothetical protein
MAGHVQRQYRIRGTAFAICTVVLCDGDGRHVWKAPRSRAKCREHIPPEGAVTMRARSPKHPFLCDLRVRFQELIYWRFRSNWRFRSILIARQPFRSPFRSFRSISIISIISIILIYFDHFDLFRFILIYFDSFRSISIHFDSDIRIAKTFRWRAGHFDRSIMSQQKWLMMAAVATSLLPLSLPLCRNMTYHG